MPCEIFQRQKVRKKVRRKARMKVAMKKVREKIKACARDKHMERIGESKGEGQ